MRPDRNEELRTFTVWDTPWAVTRDCAVILQRELRAALGPAYHQPESEGSIDHLSDTQLARLVQAWSLTLRRRPLGQVQGNRWRVVGGHTEVCIDMRRFGTIMADRTIELAETGEGGPALVVVSTPASARDVVAIFSTLED
jgi:hypothetical protein